MHTATANIETWGNVSTVVYRSLEVLKQEVYPLDQVFSVSVFQAFFNKFEANTIKSFFEIYTLKMTSFVVLFCIVINSPDSLNNVPSRDKSFVVRMYDCFKDRFASLSNDP